MHSNVKLNTLEWDMLMVHTKEFQVYITLLKHFLIGVVVAPWCLVMDGKMPRRCAEKINSLRWGQCFHNGVGVLSSMYMADLCADNHTKKNRGTTAPCTSVALPLNRCTFMMSHDCYTLLDRLRGSDSMNEMKERKKKV